jgi:hypothetical protein
MERENKMSKEILDLPLEDVPFVVFDTETSLMTHPGQPAFYDMVEIGCVAFNLKGQEIAEIISQKGGTLYERSSEALVA